MPEKRVEKTFRFHYQKGLHARVAAMVVQAADDIHRKYGAPLFIRKGNSEDVPLNSLLILTTLKIKAGDPLTILSKGDNAEAAVDAMIAYLSGDFSLQDDVSINRVDGLLQENVATAEQIFNSVATGLIVINENNIITLFNPVAERIFGFKSCNLLGKDITEVIPGTGLERVARSGVPEFDERQNIGRSIIVKNSTPILADDGSRRGAVCVFEDISRFARISWQLKEIREMKEKYQLILESMQEGICVLDEKGVITYANPEYLKILGIERKDLIGRNIREVSPNGARARTLLSGKGVFGSVSEKGGKTIVANVSPIIVDGEISGVVSVVNNITGMRELMEKLNRTSARAEYLEDELQRVRRVAPAFHKIVGSSGKLADAVAIAAKAAKSVYTVLIQGESGTGKELFAEAIHYASPRAGGPFIRVNCAAIPAPLLESELFGHEKGAFTDAVRMQLGKFELANRGTIFLDEIGDMEKDMQAKLLRFIQSKEFQRVGGEKTIRVDVKIIAATNQDLEKMVREGKFREDLYYRLNVIPILLPPLRDRKEDIPQLTDAFIRRIGAELGKQVSGIRTEALQALMDYGWPGNIRELENVLERTVTLLENDWIEVRDLPNYIREKADRPAVTGTEPPPEGEILPWDEYEKRIIGAALKKCGSYNAAAKALGLTHKTVAAKARKYGIGKTVPW